MTTIDAPNVRAVAIEGTFDDCQDLVKAMFNDAPFRERLNLTAVNSINWARVMAQTVYYVSVARALARSDHRLRAHRQLRQRLRRVGRPTDGRADRRLHRRVQRQRHPHPVHQRRRHVDPPGRSPTTSPSMDIQVSSNFERLLFEMNDRDGLRTAEQLDWFRRSGRLELATETRSRWIDGSLPSCQVRRRRGRRGDSPRVRGDRAAHRPAHGDGNCGCAPARR